MALIIAKSTLICKTIAAQLARAGEILTMARRPFNAHADPRSYWTHPCEQTKAKDAQRSWGCRLRERHIDLNAGMR